MFVIHFYLIFHNSENRYDTRMIMFKNCAPWLAFGLHSKIPFVPLHLMKVKVGKGFNEKTTGPIFKIDVILLQWSKIPVR